MTEAAQNTRTSLYGFETREVDNRRTGREKCYDIKQLWQRSHEIIGLALTGMKQTEIAKVLNVTPATVSNTLNSSLGMEKLSDMREERDEHYVKLNKKIKEAAIKAVETYHQIFDSPGTDPALKKATADTVLLDIAGLRAPTKIQSQSMNITATKEEIEEFKRRGIQAAKESGKLVVIEGEGTSNPKIKEVSDES